MTKEEENVLNLKVQKLERKMIRMKQLVSRQGFFNLYIDRLTSNETKLEVFNDLNEEYYELFGYYRYSDFNSFKNQFYKFLKE